MSEHALLKVLDTRGNEMGQAAVRLPGPQPCGRGGSETVTADLTSGGALLGKLRVSLRWEFADVPSDLGHVK
jgi:hypothetical protein